MTPFCFICIPLAVNTFYWCPCNFAVAPLPPRAPQERLSEQMPTREDRSTPHQSNWRSRLKACNFFFQFYGASWPSINYESRLNTKEMPTREDRTTKHHFSYQSNGCSRTRGSLFHDLASRASKASIDYESIILNIEEMPMKKGHTTPSHFSY